jgi:hypothetical protein
MTLNVHLSSFYSTLKRTIIRGRDGATIIDMGREISTPEAIERLNAGWRYAAEDVGGLHGYYSDELEKGVSEYVLPNRVIKVNLVRLLDGSTLKAELVPSAPEEVVGRDSTSEMAEAIPSACSVALLAFQDSSAAARTLKFDCPPNWGSQNGDEAGVNDIEFYCVMTSRFLETLTDSPDLPHSLEQAGFYRALYEVTRDDKFLRDYNEAIKVYLRTGIDMQPRYSRVQMRRH